MDEPIRTYTLEEAAEELHIAPETIAQLLKDENIDLQSRGDQRLTEDEVNRLMELMNAPTK